MGRGVVWRRDLPPEIPEDVDAPGVDKARGVVTLPQRVNWSEANPTYNLDDRRDRARVYEQVLAEGTVEDVRWFINVDDLIEMWDDLMLPRAVSRAWAQWLRTHRGIVLHDWRDAPSPVQR